MARFSEEERVEVWDRWQAGDANRLIGRDLDAALYRIVLTRMSNHPETRHYVTRRRNQGRNTTEVMRSLKRYVARQVFKHLQMA